MNSKVCQNNKVRIIAGPCAVESEDQLIAVCKHLNKLGLTYVRAGAYKPRLNPHSFQGLGSAGFDIIKKCTNKYNLKSVSEVVDEKSLHEAIDCIDVLQVGTRNMTNYSLLKAIGYYTNKTNIPVILKRGMSSKVSEWITASDYISEKGNDNIILCERGIRTFEDSTRFTLDISSVSVAKRQSIYPVCVDVSHSAGNAGIVPDLAKAAVACGADAVMIEVHPDPQNAKCDGLQQLSLQAFEKLIADIKPIAKALNKEII